MTALFLLSQTEQIGTGQHSSTLTTACGGYTFKRRMHSNRMNEGGSISCEFGSRTIGIERCVATIASLR